MSNGENVVQRTGSTFWYARLEVPVDVQPLLRRTQLWKSLRTRDKREAKIKALPVLLEWHRLFDELRKRRDPSPQDLQAAVWDHYEAQLEHDRRDRMSLPTDRELNDAKEALAADIEAGRVAWSADPVVQLNATLELRAMAEGAKFAQQAREVRSDIIRRHLATGETALIEWAADDVIQRERLIIERGSQAYRDLCQSLLRAELEYLQRAAERDRGDFTGQPTDAAVVPSDPTKGRKHAAPGETIMELYDRFNAEKRGSAGADTWASNRKIVKHSPNSSAKRRTYQPSRERRCATGSIACRPGLSKPPT